MKMTTTRQLTEALSHAKNTITDLIAPATVISESLQESIKSLQTVRDSITSVNKALSVPESIIIPPIVRTAVSQTITDLVTTLNELDHSGHVAPPADDTAIMSAIMQQQLVTTDDYNDLGQSIGEIIRQAPTHTVALDQRVISEIKHALNQLKDRIDHISDHQDSYTTQAIPPAAIADFL